MNVQSYLSANNKVCCGCTACFAKCSNSAIVMKLDREGFVYPAINTDLCNNCGICVPACPLSDKDHVAERMVEAYACINKNIAIREQSSSGGVFSVISEYVIDNGGAVFGVAFDKEWNAYHRVVDTKVELEYLRGSKYLQSNMGEQYSVAKDMLEIGRLVLFVGTPCQIAGLKSFLGKDFANLIAIDIICHGVPSPLVWHKYLNEIYSVNGTTISKIEFRNKANGWSDYSFYVEYNSGKHIYKKASEELFMAGFLSDLYLRPSCYQCEFKSVQRVSDITIADFWGVQYICPELHDDKGTSLIFVQSAKGERVFKKISDNLIIKQTDVLQAIQCNPSITRSASTHRYRKAFFDGLIKNDKNISVLISKYCYKRSLSDRIVKKVKGLLKKCINKLVRY